MLSGAVLIQIQQYTIPNISMQRCSGNAYMGVITVLYNRKICWSLTYLNLSSITCPVKIISYKHKLNSIKRLNKHFWRKTVDSQVSFPGRLLGDARHQW